MTKFAHLARWTPVEFDFSNGFDTKIEWVDLTARRFVEPFFDETLKRWTSGPEAPPRIKTGLDALEALDDEPSLDPAGIIFHLARCGSTLVSRLLGTLPGMVVISEPSPLNALLALHPDQVDPAALAGVVRQLVRALGRRRHGDERHLVLKTTPWNIRRREVLAAAFPETPWIWVQRDPARVVASLLAHPPGWFEVDSNPQLAAWRHGITLAEAEAMTRAEFAARMVGETLKSAAADSTGRLCIDYAELPAAVWERVVPHFGLEVDRAAIERMREESRFYSKDADRRLFSGDVPEHRPLTDAMREAVQRFAEPGYRALASGA